MTPPFVIDDQLLRQAKAALSNRDRLYWIVGGAGSGKSTIAERLSAQGNIALYDMDAHIYGSYHERFRPNRHPVNTAWATAENGLSWLLGMTWDEYRQFNQAALPEYLDLLADDLRETDLHDALIIDGGISTPGLLATVLPATQIACLVGPGLTSVEIWEGDDSRLGMKEFVYQLPDPETAWQRFLDFDRRICETILSECRESGIPICTRTAATTIEQLADQVARALGIRANAG